jgi:hypothetical protein
MKLTGKAIKALDFMKANDDAVWFEVPTSSYHGRPVLKWCLFASLDAACSKQMTWSTRGREKGFGESTLYELKNAGLVEIDRSYAKLVKE